MVFARGTSAAALSAILFACTLAAGCGGGGSSSSTPTAPTAPTPGTATADVVITIVGMNGAQSYSPNPASVKVGQTVAWRNADSVSHTSTADSGAFDTGTIGRNATSSPITMTTAGSFPYHCSFHPSMTGSLNVTQ